jgi:glycosyltransferase involved in cell wall biosynthesis
VRIRVAHVITRLILGGAQETVLLAAALADRSRFDPVVVTGPQTGPEGSLHEELAARGVEVIVVPELVRQVSPWDDLRSVRTLALLFRRLQVDVVHTNSSKAGVVGRLAARRAQVPRVLHTVHGWPFHDHQHPAAAAMWRALERRTAPLAYRLVVVAESDRVKGLAAGVGRPEQYVTVRSGLELSLYRADSATRVEVRSELGLPDDGLVLGAVNRLSPQKDPLTLVRGLARVLRERPDTRLLLVGEGPLRAEVEREAATLGVAQQVVMTGLRRDVPRLLAAMDVFVSASRWEGLPRTVLQAMATGLPVLATTADGVVDVVQDGQTGLLVPSGDAAALGRAAVRLADDPGLRDALADRARLRVPEFDAGRMVRELERLYA